jgi:glycosyltransferase involved in cell wall biosynthesis
MTQDWGVDPARDDVALLPRGTVRSVLRLHAHIAATRPDLIHVAGWGAPQSAAAILMAGARGVPAVVDLDTWRGAGSGWRNAAKRLLLPSLLRRVNHFAPGGRPQTAYLKQFGVPAKKITTVNMTVDVAGMRELIKTGGPEARATFREAHCIPQDGMVALFVGRLVSLKGIDTILVAWRWIRDRHPAAYLVIVGDGVLRGMVEAAARQDARICVVGRLPEDQVWHAYAAADFLVGASRAESWGLVVNEAMAADLPVVVTDAYGCANDLVRHGETGFVVPSNDPAALAHALAALFADEACRGVMAANARRRISAWTVEKQAGNIIRVWDRVLSSGRN